MAMPIAPTPVLSGKDAQDFLAKVKNDQAKPLYAKPTPKIEEARRMALAKWGKK
ncbi:MAG: hypothetical protein AB1916_03015 [Thermodesulfobacteriota bacterium]